MRREKRKEKTHSFKEIDEQNETPPPAIPGVLLSLPHSSSGQGEPKCQFKPI